MPNTDPIIDELLELLDDAFDPWKAGSVTGDGPSCQQPDPQ